MKVRITEDVESEMIKIEREDDKMLFFGNHWDFDRSAHDFTWLLQACGIEVEVENKPYEEW